MILVVLVVVQYLTKIILQQLLVFFAKPSILVSLASQLVLWEQFKQRCFIHWIIIN